MANSFGSLWVGTSGLQSASNGLNTTANNLSNVNTEGYVREQVVYEDRDYRKIGTAAVGTQYSGLGVDVGTIVHARDVFLDKAYRTENGRYSFYEASWDAVEEVETYLQESDGAAFEGAIEDLQSAFEEFAKDPSDTVNQNLVMQKASLFLSRASAVNEGFKDYQTIINSKISEDIDRINEIGKEIVTLNKSIQTIEAAKKGDCTAVEQAMELRDKRDLLLDELSGLVNMTYSENSDGIVYVDIEGVEFIREATYNKIGMETDLVTGFITPYWTHLSNLTKGEEEYYPVFNLDNVSADNNNDIGEIKALLLARGNEYSDYLDFYDSETQNYLASDVYEKGIGNSIMMNSEAELDTLVHEMVVTINNLFSPIDTVGNIYSEYGDGVYGTYVDSDGNTVKLETSAYICDVDNCDVGADGELPPRELFTRTGCSRYTTQTVTLYDADGNALVDEDGNTMTVTAYIYNEEDPTDTSLCYTLKSLSVNEDLVKQESLLPYRRYSDGAIDYDLGSNISTMWTDQPFNLNPSDTTATSFSEFYTKWIGEVGTVGDVYESTADSLEGTSESIESSRQGVIGVSSDEELTSMIKYQSAYNAASRYINVVNEMIEHLLSTLGS